MKTFANFRQTQESVLDNFIDHAERVALTKGSFLMRELVSNKWVYILLRGSVELYVDGSFGKLCTLDPGELVGLLESSLLEYSLYNVRVLDFGSIVYRINFAVACSHQHFHKIFRNTVSYDWWTENAKTFLQSICQKIRSSAGLKSEYEEKRDKIAQIEKHLEGISTAEMEQVAKQLSSSRKGHEKEKLRLISSLGKWSKSAFLKVERFLELNPEVAAAMKKQSSNSIYTFKEALYEIEKTNRVQKRVEHLIREAKDPYKSKPSPEVPAHLLFQFLSKTSLYTGQSKIEELKAIVSPAKLRKSASDDNLSESRVANPQAWVGSRPQIMLKGISNASIQAFKQKGLSDRTQEPEASPLKRFLVTNPDSASPTKVSASPDSTIAKQGGSTSFNFNRERPVISIRSISKTNLSGSTPANGSQDASQKHIKSLASNTTTSGFNQNLTAVNENANYYLGNIISPKLNKKKTITLKLKAIQDFSHFSHGKQKAYIE